MSAARAQFAKHVHAEAHAVIALREVRRAVVASATRTELLALIDAETTRRCQRCALPPDVLHDALEQADDQRAVVPGELA